MRFVVSSSRIIIRKSFESYFIIILSTRNVSVEILTTNDFKRVFFYWLSQLCDSVEVNLNITEITILELSLLSMSCTAGLVAAVAFLQATVKCWDEETYVKRLFLFLR